MFVAIGSKGSPIGLGFVGNLIVKEKLVFEIVFIKECVNYRTVLSDGMVHYQLYLNRYSDHSDKKIFL